METRELDGPSHQTFIKCLEEWSPGMADVGDRRGLWFRRMSQRGLRAKIAFDDRGVPDKIRGVIERRVRRLR